MKPSDKAIDAAALAIQQHGPESHVARLIAQVALHAAYTAQFHPSDEYAGLVERLNILDGNETQWSAVWEIAEEAADALSSALAERAAWKGRQEATAAILKQVETERDALAARLAPEAMLEGARAAIEAMRPIIEAADKEDSFTLESNARLAPVEKAIAAANERAADVYSKGRNTLIDQISDEDLANWDGSEEMAIVADKDGLSDVAPVEDEALVEIAMEEVEKAIAFSNNNETVVYRRWEAGAKEAFRAVIAAIRPHIEAAERERCAKIAELHSYPMKTVAGTGYNNAAKEIAAAIRSGK